MNPQVCDLRRGKECLPGSWCSHAQTLRQPWAETPSRRDPLPLPFLKEFHGGGGPTQVPRRGGGPGPEGGPGWQGGRVPGSWCSVACKGSRIVGNTVSRVPPTSRTSRIFPLSERGVVLRTPRSTSSTQVKVFGKKCF